MSTLSFETSGPVCARRFAVQAVILLGVLAFGRSLSAQEVRTPFEHFGTEHGLPGTSVTALLVDRTGFLWVGTMDGLARFDGYDFHVFRHDPADPTSLSSNQIRSLTETRDGTLWVGTDGGSIDRLRPQSGHFERVGPPGVSNFGGSSVEAVLEDSQGRIWVGLLSGGLARMDMDGGVEEAFAHDPGDPSSLGSDRVAVLQERPGGGIWVGTLGAGLNLFDPESGTFLRFRHDPSDPTSLSGDQVRALAYDGLGRLWIATDGGLVRFDERSRAFERLLQDDPAFPSSRDVSSLLLDTDGGMWIGSYGGGLLRYDPGDDALVVFRHDVGDAGSLGDDRVFRLAADRNGMLWVGLWSGGLDYFDPEGGRFGLFSSGLGEGMSLAHDDVTDIWADPAGDRLVVALYETGVAEIDLATGRVVNLDDPVLNRAGRAVEAFRVVETRDGTLVVGTMSSGLFVRRAREQRFTQYRHVPGDSTSLPSDEVRSLLESRDGTLWVGTVNGLAHFDPMAETFVRHLSGGRSLEEDRTVEVLYEDSRGGMWIGTRSGILIISPDGRHLELHPDPTDAGTLSDGSVTAVYEEARDVFWVGTASGGLNRVTSDDDFESAAVARIPIELLGSPFITGIERDDFGWLWVSTKMGLHRLHPRTLEVESYYSQHGLPGDQFTTGAHMRSASGELYFGGPGGLTVFTPWSRVGEETPPLIAISGVRGPLEAGAYWPPGRTDPLVLEHDHGTVSVEFSLLDFSPPRRGRYEYRLLGRRDEWTPLGTAREVTFADLGPGKYTLEVRGRNGRGVLSPTPATMTIHVLPPFWMTLWFRGILLVAFVGAVLGIHRLRLLTVERRNRELRRVNLALKREMEDRERAEGERSLLETQVRQAQKMRTIGTLAAGIAHDFNNVLVPILGFTEMVRRRYASDEDEFEYLGYVLDGGQRAKALVDQILLFGREGPVERMPVDFAETVRDAVRFLRASLPTTVEIHEEITDGAGHVLADANQIHQVIMNLGTNAAHAMHQKGGLMTVALDCVEAGPSLRERSPALGREVLRLAVSDNGVGISPEVLERVFDPFFTTKEVGEGTGLGLSVIHGIVTNHGGVIDIESTPGQGTRVTIYFPLLATDGPGVQVARDEPGLSNRRVLVVDDEKAVVATASALLEELGHEVFATSSPRKALDELRARPDSYDVVITDLTMPGMSGVEMTRAVREIRPDLPVVLASGYASEAAIKAAESAGVNAFMKKPFESGDLEAAIRSATEDG